MVPLNFLSYLYSIVKNTISNLVSYKSIEQKKKPKDKRKELKEVRKRLRTWYSKQIEEGKVNVHKQKVV